MGRALLVVAVAAGLKVVARLYRERLPYQTGNTGLWSLPPTPGHSSSQGRKSSAVNTHWFSSPPNPLSCSPSIKEACLGAACPRCVCTVCVFMCVCVHARAVRLCYAHVCAMFIGFVCVCCMTYVQCIYAMCVYHAHVCHIYIGSVCVLFAMCALCV